MSYEYGVVLAALLGMLGAALLTAWAVFSKYLEDKDKNDN